MCYHANANDHGIGIPDISAPLAINIDGQDAYNGSVPAAGKPSQSQRTSETQLICPILRAVTQPNTVFRFLCTVNRASYGNNPLISNAVSLFSTLSGRINR